MGLNIRAALELGRVSNLPTCISNATVGFYLGGSSPFDEPLLWLMSILTTISFYEAGIILNDVCDYKIDLIERPNRPIPSGRIHRITAIFTVISLFLIGWVIVRVYLPKAWLIAFILTFFIVIYDLFHSDFKLSPILMGLCRGSIYLLTASAAGWHLRSDSVVFSALGLGIYISSISFIAREETWVGLSFLQKGASILVILVLLALFGVPGQTSILFFLAMALALVWLAPIVISLFRKRIHTTQAVGKMLAAMSLFDGVILARVPTVSGAIIAWICFFSTVFGHRKVRGT